MLRVDFITQGQQLVSTASDGLLKIWNVKDEECVTSLDNHEDKVSLFQSHSPRSYPYRCAFYLIRKKRLK